MIHATNILFHLTILSCEYCLPRLPIACTRTQDSIIYNTVCSGHPLHSIFRVLGNCGRSTKFSPPSTICMSAPAYYSLRHIPALKGFHCCPYPMVMPGEGAKGHGVPQDRTKACTAPSKLYRMSRVPVPVTA